MPQKALLTQPPAVSGNLQLPEGDPNSIGNQLERFITTGLGGEQLPGDLASALGAGVGAVAVFPGLVSKARGLALINKLKRNGLPVIANNAITGTREVPPHIMNALEMAQKRWPRLFGHLNDITDVDAAVSVPGRTTFGRTVPVLENPKNQVISELQLSADALSKPAAAYNTVGHELLHVKDNLTKGREGLELYRDSKKLPGGYDVSAQEIRARLQGARMKAYARGLQRREVEPYTSPVGLEHYAIKMPGEVPKPIDSRISGLPPEPMPAVKGPIETNEEKLIRMLQERFDRQSAGMPPDPRVPRK